METEHGVTTVTPDDSATGSINGSTTTTMPETEVEDEPTTTLPPVTVPPAPEAPAAVTQTVPSTGGSITVTLDNGALHLDDVSPATGFTVEVHDNTTSRIEVRFFDADGKEWRIRVEVAGGAMTQEITIHG